MVQYAKIITDLFSISYFYLGRASGVKSKLDDLGPQYPVIRAVNINLESLIASTFGGEGLVVVTLPLSTIQQLLEIS